jgi:hypothetical protein
LELANVFIETFFRDFAISLMDSRLFSFLSIVEAPYAVENSAGGFSSQTADNRRWISEGVTPSFHRKHVVHFCPR